MSKEENYSLLIWCGALWDIAEKSKEFYTSVQIEEIRINIENLCGEVSVIQNFHTLYNLIENKKKISWSIQ